MRPHPKEFPYMPGRVTHCKTSPVFPLFVDLAAMRDAVADKGGDPENHQSQLFIPISSSITQYRSTILATPKVRWHSNIDLEFERNVERYKLLKWSQIGVQQYAGHPSWNRHRPSSKSRILGICCQRYSTTEVNDRQTIAYPDTCVGTDSHTTMINGLGVLGWGVGGIEAEAVMLGQPYYMLVPEVVGVKLTGSLA